MKKKKQKLLNEISAIINKNSTENESNTPDFILAQFLMKTLRAFNKATNQRDSWSSNSINKTINKSYPWRPYQLPLNDNNFIEKEVQEIIEAKKQENLISNENNSRNFNQIIEKFINLSSNDRASYICSITSSDILKDLIKEFTKILETEIHKDILIKSFPSEIEILREIDKRYIDKQSSADIFLEALKWFNDTTKNEFLTKTEIMKTITDEPELPQEMPETLFDSIKTDCVQNDKESITKLLRFTVAKTKTNIMERLTDLLNTKNERGYVFAPFICTEHTEESLKEYDEFMKKYRKEHELCPVCGGKAHSTTLMAYAYNHDKPDDYRDLNICQCCCCSNKHTNHARISAEKFNMTKKEIKK